MAKTTCSTLSLLLPTAGGWWGVRWGWPAGDVSLEAVSSQPQVSCKCLPIYVAMKGGGHPWIGACSSVCSTELSSTHLDPWSDFRQRDLVESAELWKIWAHVLPQKPLFFHLQKDARSYAGLPESLCGLRRNRYERAVRPQWRWGLC